MFWRFYLLAIRVIRPDLCVSHQRGGFVERIGRVRILSGFFLASSTESSSSACLCGGEKGGEEGGEGVFFFYKLVGAAILIRIASILRGFSGVLWRLGDPQHLSRVASKLRGTCGDPGGILQNSWLILLRGLSGIVVRSSPSAEFVYESLRIIQDAPPTFRKDSVGLFRIWILFPFLLAILRDSLRDAREEGRKDRPHSSQSGLLCFFRLFFPIVFV